MKGKPTEEDFRKMGEEFIEHKKSLIAEEMNRLEGKDLNLTISLRCVHYYSPCKARNKTMCDFYC